MRWLLSLLLVLHGLIHLMGFAKAFGLAALPQLTQPISKGLGLVWLTAAVTLLVAATLQAAAARTWWVPGLVGLLLSQLAIVSSWSDARYGTLANLLIATAIAYAIAADGPWSFSREYARDVGARLARRAPEAPIAAADLRDLPPPVQRYLHVTGSVGQPRVHHVKAFWRGRIREGPGNPWMPFTAEQHNFFDEPARFFRMDARRGGVPVDVFHRFAGGMASMRVRVASLFTIVDSSGPDLTRAETVTLFNDLCILAPARLVDPDIRWRAVSDHEAHATYTAGAHTITASLLFGDNGDLVDFVSDDRLVTEGASLVPRRWSTPIGDYRRFGARRVATRGEGRWHPPEGAFTYIELELLELRTNE